MLVIGLSLMTLGASSTSSPIPPKTEQHQSLAEHQATPSDTRETQTEPRPTEINPAASTLVSNQQAEYQKRSAERERPLPTVTDWIIVGVTSAYAVVALFTLLAIKRQADLAEQSLVETRRAVEIASETSKATALALREDRPILVVKNVTMDHGQWQQQRYFGATAHVHNIGKRVAVVTEARLSHVCFGDRELLRVERPIFEWAWRCIISQPIIPIDGVFEIYPFLGMDEWWGALSHDAWFTSEDRFQMLMNNHLHLITYGMILYRDAAVGDEYRTEFYWHYRHPRDDAPNGDWFIGRPDFQRHT